MQRKEMIATVAGIIEGLKNDESQDLLEDLYLELYGAIRTNPTPPSVQLQGDYSLYYSDYILLIKKKLQEQEYDVVEKCYTDIFSESQYIKKEFLISVIKLLEDVIYREDSAYE